MLLRLKISFLIKFDDTKIFNIENKKFLIQALSNKIVK